MLISTQRTAQEYSKDAEELAKIEILGILCAITPGHNTVFKTYRHPAVRVL